MRGQLHLCANEVLTREWKSESESGGLLRHLCWINDTALFFVTLFFLRGGRQYCQLLWENLFNGTSSEVFGLRAWSRLVSTTRSPTSSSAASLVTAAATSTAV